MKTFFAFIFGIVIGAAGLWFYESNRNNPSVRAAADRIEQTTQAATDAMGGKLHDWHMAPDDIRDELARSGKVIREKARELGKNVADDATDARITTTIKGKLLADRATSAVSISVSTAQGVVTLSGTAPSLDSVSRAMFLAMNTDGVQQVISTIQVKAG